MERLARHGCQEPFGAIGTVVVDEAHPLAPAQREELRLLTAYPHHHLALAGRSGQLFADDQVGRHLLRLEPPWHEPCAPRSGESVRLVERHTRSIRSGVQGPSGLPRVDGPHLHVSLPP